MSEHTNKQFDADLQRIRTELLQMGGLVESMIQDSMDALATGDISLVDRVKEREKDVNRLEVEIDDRVTTILARHQPAAIDLRTLLAVTKMLTDMERSGDEADKIASMARRIHEDDRRFIPVIELRHMANSVVTMMRQVMDAFARNDSVLAAAVVRSDKEVDKEWKSALRSLITYMIEDPRTISRSIDLLFIARSMERIGDHCKNMAERVIYMVHGADVRHKGVKMAERLVRGEEIPTPEETEEDK
ncbi:phosphate signaling complex protein PhoU [Orrella sp. NBD-18]|uniref:Phosphate-specific transport system accessory protein PhoU n=1 Tax=Sheuella amnicola TaxID=2707330 RepID=A0A6B2R0R4_9BURK|nr:phosphate signaling complex protein PhoU [Sheuella amnicola]NDY83911.1 phosphate signaling complex protein PhoU [Sheuella amnicola]HBI82269.1 phosphate transport system regulatory protein PhoU [Alcaligenaceae bacterium]